MWSKVEALDLSESPFSNYISSLSPIKHDKAPHVAQGFIGLNSPPLVFTSPRINTIGRPQSSSVEASRNGEGDKKITHESCILERSLTEFQEGLVTDIRNEDDNKDNVSVQPSSSSGCVDEYLADPVESDCVNSAYAVNSNLKQSNNVLQSSVSGLADSKNIKIGNKNNVGIENEQGAAQGLSDELQKFESDTFDLSSKEKECKNLVPQKVVEDHGNRCNGFLQHLPGSLQGIQSYEDTAENVGGNVDVPVHSMTHDLEANELQRGMSRRCLQFGEAQPQARANSSISTNLADNIISSASLATTSETEGLGSSHLDSSVTSRTNQLVNLSQLAINLIPQCYSEKSSLTVPKPSGYKSTCQSTENMGSCSDEFEKVLAPPQDGTLEVNLCTIADSAVSESLSAMESIECKMTLNTKRKFSSEDGDSEKVKKLLNSTDGEGCKRCNCKRTKCLKLYCDCFAAGIYCAEPCSCQGCLNRPEYEDTVLETRKQIESRNPLAFAPKIVQPFTEFPLSNREDGNRKTPSSARHKRGCNCKRSMCLKKYCECYQANVGCSIGCRCEGCKNVYGKKEDYCVTEEMINRSGGRLESRVTTKPKKDVLHSELFDPHHSTPLTPSFQCSDHGKKASISKLLSRRCLPSPESDLTILSYAKSPRSPRTSDSNDMLLETSKEKLDIESYCEGIGYNNAVVLADEFHHTPLPNHPSNVIGSSLCKVRELTNLSRFQLDPRSGSLTSGGSLRWHSSPITPMSPLDEIKNLQGLDSADGGLFDILEDDMPEILKDTSMAIKPVKAGSPNGKRVSPPHNLHQLGSSSSGPLRSGRKFILKAVPSFPPLTPCIDSKGSGTQSKNDLQENRSND
ncbi:Protein tesmin/TSO1-like CXC 2 [Hibiscus syriacus]|uniref:Protein tesmin/TSO1-like CXC 2 n=1 Tax=Hibiscus syriacus TaxID=106335 RepID=A0A6A2XHK8_HIBSY|nr:Protein tesmin/TSO1-like CXC 2 [Hibiscus syriacus]